MESKKVSMFKRISLLVGVLIIPTIYSLCYLQAYWDPYNSIDKLPVAVVNQDAGAQVDGKQENLGNDLEQDLKDSDSLKCSFVSLDQAQSGVSGNQYYAAIVVPQDFSKNIASASGTNKQTATILYEPNQEHNYVASLLLKSAVNTIVTGLKGKVDENITDNLSLKLQEVPGQLQTLKDGLDQLNSGAGDLQQGIQKVSDGQDSLTTGAQSLQSGLIDLSKGADDLNGGAGTLDNGLAQAESGAEKLNDGAANLSTLNAGITTANQGAASLSGGLSQLMAQFGTNASDPTLKDNINALNGGAKTVAGQFAGGSTSNLKYAVSSLASSSGAPSYVDNVNGLVSTLRSDSGVYGSVLAGLAGATDASKKQAYAAALVLLTDTANPTEMGQTEAALGLTAEAISQQQGTLSGGGNSIKQGVAAIAAQFAAAPKGQAPTLYDGVQQLAGGTAELAAQMKTSGDAKSPSLYDSVNALSAGASQLANGTAQLAAGESNIASLQSGIGSLTDALRKLKTGSAQLYSGSQTLVTGASSAKDGSDKLVSGSKDLRNGLDSVQSGASKLADGAQTADSSVGSAVQDANNSMDSTNGLGDFAKDPVQMQENDVNPVQNYGTAFAPFFISLSLWVGALMLFFSVYFDWIRRYKILSPATEHLAGRTVLFLAIGVAQAIVLCVIAQAALKLTIADVPLFYLSCILFSLVAVSIIQFLLIHVGDVGKLITILILIFSLTSTGGTFPVETVPQFYSSLYAFLPMSYSIDLLRQCIIGYHNASAMLDITVEICIIAAFTFLTLFLSFHKKKKGQGTILKIEEPSRRKLPEQAEQAHT